MYSISLSIYELVECFCKSTSVTMKRHNWIEKGKKKLQKNNRYNNMYTENIISMSFDLYDLCRPHTDFRQMCNVRMVNPTKKLTALGTFTMPLRLHLPFHLATMYIPISNTLIKEKKNIFDIPQSSHMSFHNSHTFKLCSLNSSHSYSRTIRV